MTSTKNEPAVWKVNVADAKRDFSEIMSRVAFKNERILIERRGKPMAALVSVEDLERLEQASGNKERKGMLAAAGAWEDYPRLDELVKDIYQARERSKDRKVRKLR